MQGRFPLYLFVKLTILIVARNEAAHLRHLLPRLRALPYVTQIVVCDGNSSDDSQHIAHENGADWNCASGGRGAQLQAGSALATGEVLWFLHADCFPIAAQARAIARALQDERVIGGNFRVCFLSPIIAARVFEIIARVLRTFGMYYGDSGIWVRRDVYTELGGFRAWPLFEDYEFARRLECFAARQKKQTVYLRPALRISSRRIESAPWRVLRLWLRQQIGYWRGGSPFELARRYHK